MEKGLAMTSPRLEAYLDLERSMLALDELSDPLADKLRDAMDPIWYALTDEERAMLSRRELQPPALRGTSVAKVLRAEGGLLPGLPSLTTLVEPRTTSGTSFRADLRAA